MTSPHPAPIRRRAVLAAGATVLVGGLAPQLAAAQSTPAAWPTRPVRIVVPYAPSSSPDVLVRSMSEALAKRLGQPVVVENRPGAGGNTGTDYVSKAAPDGYTLIVSTNGPLVYNTVMYKSLPYDPFRDLAPITLAGAQPNVCAVSPSMGANNVREWVEALRRNPGKFNFSSTGVGSMSHLSVEIIKLRTNTFAVHIPYASSPLAITAILQGDVHMACVPAVAVMPQARAGKLKAIAVTSAERNPQFPDIPTLRESGFPEIEAIAWMALLAPAKTPPEIVQRLNRDMVETLKQPDVVERLQRAFIDPIGSTPEALGRWMQDELKRWTPVIKRSGATVE
jgi:tripartite-type tricarboxylate transporter receptor subunit TctC